MADEVVEKKETKKANGEKVTKKSIVETIVEVKKQEDEIFSRKEYHRQLKKERAIHSKTLIIIFAVIFGVFGLVRGIQIYNNTDQATKVITQPLLFALVGAIVGLLIKLIVLIFVKIGFEKEKLAQYKVLEEKIKKLEIDKKEDAAKSKRKNKIFICSIRRGAQSFNSYRMHLRIGQYDLGEFYGVQSIEVEPGQYTLSGSFFFIYENQYGTVYTKDQTLPNITVNVGSGGAFIFLDVCIPSNSPYNFTYTFKEVTSRQFNEQAQKYGIKEYY